MYSRKSRKGGLTVSCAKPRDLVHAYLDRELDLGKSLEMEEHFRQCATCCQAYEEGRRLRTALNEGGLYFNTPPDLRKRIRAVTRGAARSNAGARSFRWRAVAFGLPARSEEHTSELQSRPHLVCRLLLEKKKRVSLGHGRRRRFGDI